MIFELSEVGLAISTTIENTRVVRGNLYAAIIGDEEPNLQLSAACDALEALALACAREGLDVGSDAFRRAMRHALDSVTAEYTPAVTSR